LARPSSSSSSSRQGLTAASRAAPGTGLAAALQGQQQALRQAVLAVLATSWGLWTGPSAHPAT
jgi:hypothetical protein